MKRPFYSRVYKEFSTVDYPEVVVNVKNVGEIFCLQYVAFKPTGGLTSPFWVYVGVADMDYMIYMSNSLGTNPAFFPTSPIWLPENTYIRFKADQTAYYGAWIASIFGYTSPLREGMV